MAPFTALSCFALVVLFLSHPISGQTVFDVTKFGAKADGKSDNSKAFLAAWTAACSHVGDSTVVVPNGNFVVGSVIFKGPCSNQNRPPTFQIQGNVTAPSNINTLGWLEFRALHGFTICGSGTVDGQGSSSWSNVNGHKSSNNPISIRLIQVTNTTISDLHVVNAKGFHVAVQRCSNMIVRNLKISAPADSPNTDGVHISMTDHIDVSGLTIATGDDCIGMGPGSTNVTIRNVVCGPGHGISVGSLGKYKNEMNVMGVFVKDCTVAQTTNGVRIKTWPGSSPSVAANISFENIIMRNVTNPIIIDQVYCPGGGNGCSSKPSLVKVRDITFKNITGTTNSPVGVSVLCSKGVPCENVQFADIDLTPVVAAIKNVTATITNVLGQAPVAAAIANLTNTFNNAVDEGSVAAAVSNISSTISDVFKQAPVAAAGANISSAFQNVLGQLGLKKHTN